MNPVTPCRGRPAVYDAALHPHTPTKKRYQARLIAAALCARCPIAASCSDRITQPAARPRSHRKATAMSTEPTPTPAPTPVTPPKLVTQPQPDQPLTHNALIAWGAAHASSRVQSLAGKASSALNDLRKAYGRDSKVAGAEARVERLRAQLANAQRDLAAAKGAKPKTAAVGPAVDYTAVRAWAAEQGIEMAPVGRPRREVVDACHAAQHAA